MTRSRLASHQPPHRETLGVCGAGRGVCDHLHEPPRSVPSIAESASVREDARQLMMKTAIRGLGSLTLVFSAFLTLGLAACSDDETGDGTGDETGETGDETGETGETGDGLEIVGDYVDDYTTEHSITEEQWSFAGSIFEIVEYDNEQMYVLAQNDEANMFNPGQWSRFDWTWDGDQLYYCQSVYDGMSIDDARNGSANPGDLEAGCGTFPWSMLIPG